MAHARLKTLLTLSLICAIIFAFICSFLLVKVSDEAGGLIGNQLVRIDQSDGKISASEFREKVIEFANENKADVFLTLPDPSLPQAKWILYIASASSTSVGGQWLENGYPTFSRNSQVITKSLGEYQINDPRGSFYIDGPPQSDEKFLAMAKEHGMNGSIFKSNALNYLRSENAAFTIVVIFILLVTMSVIHVIVRSRHLAIAIMIGQRISIFVVKEFINSLTGAWTIFVPLLITATGFLWWYNSFHRIGLMLVGFFILLTTYIIAMCLSCWGTAKVLYITPLISAIKGGVPGKQLIWSAYVVRLGIILLTCSLSFSLVSYFAQYSIRVKEAPLWQQHDQAIALFISSTAGSKYYETLGPLLRDMERENKLILSQPQWNLGLHNSPEDLPQLLVNTEYAKNELGFSPKKSGVVYVLYPLDAPQEDIDKAVNAVKLQYGDYQGLNIETLPQPVDFSAFSYQSEFSGFSHDLMLKRPIVTVLPYGLEMVTDRNMSALTTSRHLLMKDEATVKQLQSSTNSLNLIAGWRPAQSQWQEVTAKLGVDTRAATLNLGILLVVLLVLILSCVTTFSLQYRDRLRASLVIGVPFICAYIGFLIVEMTFMLVPFIYLGYRQSAYNAAIAEGVPRAIELSRSAAVTPTIAAVTVGLAVFWIITAIWLAERRYTRAWHTQ